ncbi:hypothetical protein NA57DRAFT_71229 [Rhizodiscina lignyota]|uniref:ABM domain-containing protein n=1 Tax=Rhizodiscina lignyota TaxID=1504668 RepID=A0A9P4IS46_9PEZI|nr:hypothetical protein NA57DRAFT_71229 [Rhizodiscina lignyota]
MAEPVSIIIAIITPKPGNFDKVWALLDDLIAGVKDLEPNCTLFQAHREVEPSAPGEEEIFMIERFKDNDAVVFHRENPALLNITRIVTEHNLLTKPIYTKTVRPEKGFVRT